ncbi:MAG: sensor histidine kinase [Lachnospiraceae bacterium]
MVEWIRKFLYRIFCVLALLVSVYLIVDFLISGTFDYRVFLMFLLMVVVIIWGIADWRKSYLIMQKQETEIKLYQHYVQPLEELVKEIRIKQHEFDNHLNAILNMHLTVDNYEELVMRQSAYITEVIRDDDSRQYLPLLRISDKVLAGFLYSKIVRSPSFVKTEVEVKSLEIISGISEHHLIEIVGTLVDNAYEACTEEKNQVMMEVDSENDRLVFSIKNQIEDDRLSEIGRFFEKGYSTKDDAGKHGLGLYKAKKLVRKYKGDIFVCTDKIEDTNYICMRVVV